LICLIFGKKNVSNISSKIK